MLIGLIIAVVVIVVVVVVATTTKSNKGVDTNTLSGGGKLGGKGASGTWGQQPTTTRNSTLSGKSPTGSGGSGLDKLSCYFESIDIFFDTDDDDISKQQNKVPIYKKDTSIKKMDNLYFISNPKGKNIKIEAKRVNNKCTSPSHQNIKISDKNIENSGSIMHELKYKDISGLSQRLSYFGLPVLDDVTEELKFASCEYSCNTKIIVYPDIKYSFELKYEHEIDKETRKDEKTLSFSYNSDYNNVKDKLEAGLGIDGKADDTLRKLNDFFELVKKIAKAEDNVRKFMNITENPFARSKILDFELIPIGGSIGCEWQYCTNDKHNKIGNCYKISGGLKPLLGGKATWDILLTILQSISGGTAVVVVSFIEYFNKLMSCTQDEAEEEMLYIKLETQIQLDITADLVFYTKIDRNANGEVSGTVPISLELKAGIIFGGGTEIFKVKAEASASAKIEFIVKIFLKYDKSLSLGSNGELQPFEITLVAKGEVGFWFIKMKGSVEKTFTIGEKTMLYEIPKISK